VVQATSRGARPFFDEIIQRRTAELLVRSVLLSAAVTVAAVVIGVFAAWVTSLSGVRGKVFWTVLFSMPLAIPSYISAFTWVSWIPSLSGFAGAFIVLTFACFPYVMLPVMAVFSRIDPSHEEVAKSLGRSPLNTFFSVTLPQARRATLSGALLVALYVLGDFGAVAVMRHEVFTWVIYGAYRSGFNPTRAASLSLVLLVLALVLTAAESRARGRQAKDASSARTSRRRMSSPIRIRLFATIMSTAIVIPSVGVPVVSVVSWLQRESTRRVGIADVLSSAATSFGIGVAAAVFCLMAALPVALMSVRHPSRVSRALSAATYVTHSLPALVVGISVVYLGIRAVTPLYQELPLLVFAHVILFIPAMVTTLETAIEKSPIRLEEISASLGSSSVATFLRVTLPLALPGLLAGSALTMLAAVKELPASLLLLPTGWDTLSTDVWRFAAVSDYAAVAPPAITIIALAAVPTAILGALTSTNLTSDS
jgi:iron(III) transport system permease protein